MTPRDDDFDPDAERPRSRRRANRDILNLDEQSDGDPRRGAAARRTDAPRVDEDGRDRYDRRDDGRRDSSRRDDDRRDDDRRDEDRRDHGRRDDDRDPRQRRDEPSDDRERGRRRDWSDDDRWNEPPRERDARRRGDEDRDERAPAKPSKDDPKTDEGKGDDKAGDTKAGDKGDDAKGGGDKAAQEQRKKRRPVVIGIVALVALLLVAGGAYYFVSTRGKVDTDDAFTDGNVVTISPQVSGQVIALEVGDNQFVHKGDVLVRIDPRQFTFSAEQSQGMLESAKAQVANQKLGTEIAKKNFPASLQLAKATLESAQSNLALQKSNYERQKSLPKQATTQQDVDSTNSQFQQAQAQVEQAQARVVQAEPVQQSIGQSEEQGKQYVGQADQAQGQLDQANLNIEWATVRAPQDGWVTRRNVNAGNYVSAGTQIMSLVTTDVWITANYKETELDGMRPGQRVTIKIDAYPDLDIRGHVDSIQRGTGSRFSAFPAENATGNFVKIVQRVPVKIVIDSGVRSDEPLPLGVSVVPTVLLQ